MFISSASYIGDYLRGSYLLAILTSLSGLSEAIVKQLRQSDQALYQIQILRETIVIRAYLSLEKLKNSSTLEKVHVTTKGLLVIVCQRTVTSKSPQRPHIIIKGIIATSLWRQKFKKFCVFIKISEISLLRAKF